MFILTTARLTAATQTRTGQRRAQLGQRFLIQDTAAPDPVEGLDLRRMGDCLGRLAAHARQVIILTYYADRTAAQIAAEIGSTSGAVRIARHRAMEQLRSCMGLRTGG